MPVSISKNGDMIFSASQSAKILSAAVDAAQSKDQAMIEHFCNILDINKTKLLAYSEVYSATRSKLVTDQDVVSLFSVVMDIMK